MKLSDVSFLSLQVQKVLLDPKVSQDLLVQKVIVVSVDSLVYLKQALRVIQVSQVFLEIKVLVVHLVIQVFLAHLASLDPQDLK